MKPLDGLLVVSIEQAVAALKGEKVEAKVVMAGVLIAREDPQAVMAFGARLKELIALGNK